MANVLVIKPLPIREPDRLGWIFGKAPEGGEWRGPISLPEYVTYRDGSSALRTLTAYQRRTFTMTADGGAERVLGQVVIGDLQGLWGLRAARGRTLASGDERSGAPAVAVLSHRFWLTRFGAASDIVGRAIRINGEHRTIVGVLTPDIELGTITEIDLWMPYQGDAALASRTDRSWRGLGRLADGATVETAHAQVSALAEQMASEHPDTDFGPIGPGRSDTRCPRHARRVDHPLDAGDARRPAAPPRVRQRDEPADCATDCPPPGAGRMDSARRHARPDLTSAHTLPDHAAAGGCRGKTEDCHVHQSFVI